MKVLHLTVHLGGGIGKAHAALAPHLPAHIRQRFVLLQEPIDNRHVDTIMRHGGEIITGADTPMLRLLIADADVVQFEYWGHPALDELIAKVGIPQASVCWLHISGFGKPSLPLPLLDSVGRVALTSPISRPLLPPQLLRKTSVINSGFGFAGMGAQSRPSRRKPTIAYLGTVDFKKLHRGIFDAVDALDDDMTPVSLWGHISPEVAACAAARRHPERIELRGHTLDPVSALAEADIFFYPLRRDHYGTAENALLEAMSMGLVPVVLDNPAETKIVTHGKSGFVAHTIDECVSRLRQLVQAPSLRDEMGAGAAREAQTKSPARSANAFVELWAGLIAERGSDAVRPDPRLRRRDRSHRVPVKQYA
jgi:glycosyltransferase involved in cell wall biosynthesis